MSKPTNTTLIGSFVLGGLILLIGAIVILGSGRFFTNNITYIAYFSGSVKGLSIGSPVRFRGAQIGNVRDIRLELRKGEHGEALLPVKFELSAERVNHIGGKHHDQSKQDAYKIMNELINQGVKASLAMDSIVTAQLYIDLDFHQEELLNYVGGTGSFLEMPTARSPFEKITSSIKELPIENLVSAADKALQSISDILSSDDTKATVANLKELTEKGRDLVVTLEKNITPLSQSANATLTDTRATLKSIKETSDALRATTADESSPLHYQLITTMQELEKASRSIQMLSDFLQRNPETIIQGKQKDQ